MAFLNLELAQSFAQLIRQWHQQGHSAATGTNYSFRNDHKHLAISASGIDKSQFSVQDWLLCNAKGEVIGLDKHRKSSAETALHLQIYELEPKTQAIAHSHSRSATLLSSAYLERGYLSFSGYEVLKAFRGISTHEAELEIPIFPNSQNMEELRAHILKAWEEQGPFPAYLIAKHGFYTWGQSLAETKRHFEVLDFLLQCEYELWLHQKPY